MLSLRVSKEAGQFISGRPPKHQRQIVGRIHELRTEPRPADSRPVKGSEEGFIRADVGEYRIVYRVESSTLYVALVGKRNDDQICRRLRRE